MKNKPSGVLAIDGPYQPRIDAAGFGKTVAMTRARPRSNCNYLLTTVRDDSMAIYLQDGTAFQRQGAGTWIIPPNVPYTVRLTGGGTLHWVHFSVLWAQQWWDFSHRADFSLARPGREKYLQPTPRETWGIDLPLWLPETVHQFAESVVPDMVDYFLAGESADRIRANGSLATFLMRLVSDLRHKSSERPAMTSQNDEVRVRFAERFARRQMGRDVSVTDMATEAGWSRTHFSAIYRRLRGESPGAFVRRLRLDEAAILLRTQNASIADVGVLVGYPDPSVFGRAFRRQFGLSPGAYRDSEQL